MKVGRDCTGEDAVENTVQHLGKICVDSTLAVENTEEYSAC